MGRFLKNSDVVPSAVTTSDPQLSNEILQQCISFHQKYEAFRQQVKEGLLGKTAQFWVVYLNLMSYQHLTHLAIQENDFGLRLFCWKQFIPYYFALNKVNYARYGSYYTEIMQNIDILHLGLRQIMCISVQAQDKYPLRNSIGQRGEQSINCDAKTRRDREHN